MADDTLREGWCLFSSAAEAPALARAPMAGLLPHLALYLPMNTMRFGAYERAKPLVGWHVGERPAWWMPFGAGAGAEAAVALTIHPLFVVKTFQQAHRVAPREAVRRLLQVATLLACRFKLSELEQFATYLKKTYLKKTYLKKTY